MTTMNKNIDNIQIALSELTDSIAKLQSAIGAFYASLPPTEQDEPNTNHTELNHKYRDRVKTNLYLKSELELEPPYPVGIMTPSSIASAIAHATNLEMKNDGNYYCVGYINSHNEFVSIADFYTEYLQIKITNKTVGPWMREKVVEIMKATADNAFVATYRKLKSQKLKQH